MKASIPAAVGLVEAVCVEGFDDGCLDGGLAVLSLGVSSWFSTANRIPARTRTGTAAAPASSTFVGGRRRSGGLTGGVATLITWVASRSCSGGALRKSRTCVIDQRWDGS